MKAILTAITIVVITASLTSFALDACLHDLPPVEQPDELDKAAHDAWCYEYDPTDGCFGGLGDE